MRGGHLLQVGAPEELYNQPSSAFVAGFMGATNLLRCQASGCVARLPSLGELELDRSSDGDVLLSLRPEDLALDCASRASDGEAVGCILSRQFKGHDITYVLRLPDDQQVTVQTMGDCPFKVGEHVLVQQKKPAVVLGDAPGTFTLPGQ